MVDSLGEIVKRTESTSNHYGNKTTEERCVIQLLISSAVALQKICSYCRKCTQNMQKICSYCRKCAQNMHKICRYCRKYVSIAENMCRKYAAIAENLQLLHIFCNTYRFSAIATYFLQYLQILCIFCAHFLQ